jgi:hypothetical protein
MQALGGVIGRLRTLSYDFEHQRCDARHIHAELQEIIAELEGILARSSAAPVPNLKVPRSDAPVSTVDKGFSRP